MRPSAYASDLSSALMVSGRNIDHLVALSAEEREIGGLGIYMVKQSMDEITYEYKDGQNILKIKKNI